jgi:hypothetical protein
VPISSDEFDAREWNVEAALRAFLRDHSNLAYTAPELLLELERIGVKALMADVEAALADSRAPRTA